MKFDLGDPVYIYPDYPEMIKGDHTFSSLVLNEMNRVVFFGTQLLSRSG